MINFKKTLLLMASIYTTVCMAQNTFSVTGRVFDSKRMPVNSANIRLAGGHDDITAATDKDGFFKIKCKQGSSHKLTVSCVGFNEKEYTIKRLDSDIELDSILLEEKIVELDETVITPKAIKITHDRRILYPTDKQKRNSADGVSLLSMMKLPRVTIIPGTNDVKYWGKGNLKYYINDTKATVAQIRALLPTEIARVEYIDNPGLEYQEQDYVGLVIRVITKGGMAGVYNSIVIDKPINRSEGTMNIESRVTGKQTELAISYNGFLCNSDSHFNPETTDELFYMPDAVVHRREKTTGMTSYERNHDISLAYFHTRPGKDYLYVKTEARLNRQPNNTTFSVIDNFVSQNSLINKQKNTSEESNTFVTNLLYRKTLDKKQMLLLDATYYMMHSDDYRHDIETSVNEATNEIVSDADAITHGGSVSGMYSNVISGQWILQASAASSLYFSKSNYYGNYTGMSKVLRNLSTLNGRLAYRTEKTEALLTLQMSINHTNAADRYKSTVIEPKFTLQSKYLFDERCYISGTIGYTPIRPQAGDMSTAQQQIDEYQIRCGNPELRHGHAIGIDIDANVGFGILDINPYLSYERTYKNIQEETFLRDGMIVRMPNNFDYVNAFKSGVEISLEPADWLTILIAAGYNRFSSKSMVQETEYNYGKMWVRTNVNARWKGWTASYNMWTHNNDFYGEVLETSGRSMSFSLQRVFLGGRMSASLRIQNPFSKSFSWQDVANYSPIAPYTNRTCSDYSFRLLTLSMTYKFNKGRKTAGKSIKTDITPDNYIINSRKSAEIKQY